MLNRKQKKYYKCNNRVTSGTREFQRTEQNAKENMKILFSESEGNFEKKNGKILKRKMKDERKS